MTSADKTFIIDGYNLLHAIPELADKTAGDLESRRQRFLARLAALSAGRRVDFQVVFDGVSTQQGRSEHPGIKIIFASPSADHYIRNFISRNERRRDLVIVTSDAKDIGHYAKLHALEWMKSDAFWSWIQADGRSRAPESGPSSERSAPPGWTAKDDEILRQAFEREDSSGEN